MNEATLVLLKPDAVKRRMIGQIIQRIEEQGWRIMKIRMIWFTPAQLEELYQQHKSQPWFDDQIKFMHSQECVALEVQGENAVAGLRRLVGPTRVLDREPGTIRWWSNDHRENLAHCSDSPEAADRELRLLF